MLRQLFNGFWFSGVSLPTLPVICFPLSKVKTIGALYKKIVFVNISNYITNIVFHLELIFLNESQCQYRYSC